MKKLLRNMLFFFVPIALVNCIIFLILEKNYFSIYEKTNIDPEKHHSFILCDSHGLALGAHLNATGVYNFSAASDSYFDIERKLFYLIDKGIEIKKIVISADDHTLSFYRESFNNTDRSVFFMPSYNENDNIIDNQYEYIKQKYVLKYIPLLRPKTRTIVRNTVNSFFNKTTHERDNWVKIKNKESVSKIRSDIQFQGDKQSEKLKKALLDIVSVCKEKNISLTAIKYPLSGDYIKAVNGRSFNADDLLRDHGVRVLDYTAIYTDRDSLFMNQDHLNDLGGIEFSKLLKKDIFD